MTRTQRACNRPNPAECFYLLFVQAPTATHASLCAPPAQGNYGGGGRAHPGPKQVTLKSMEPPPLKNQFKNSSR